MSRSYRVIGLWLVLIVLFVAVWQFFGSDREPRVTLTWSEVMSEVRAGRLAALDVRSEGQLARGTGYLADGRRFITQPRPLADFAEAEAEGVEVSFHAAPEQSVAVTALTNWLPIAVVFVVFLWLRRAMTSKSAANALDWDVAALTVESPSAEPQGLSVAKERLLAALEALRNGTPGPRRILIVGPSGSGKSALVRWLATRGLPVFAVPGSQFVEVFVGNGAARVRKLFKVAAEKQPCVVAIDDFDAFATRRVIPDTKGLVDERGATMLEFAGALDGLRQLPPRVLVIATTSRADVLDEAVVRPGRFDLRLELQLDRESSAQELRA